MTACRIGHNDNDNDNGNINTNNNDDDNYDDKHNDNDNDNENDNDVTAQSWKAYFFCSSAMVVPDSLRTGLLITMKPSSRTSRMLSLMLASESFARSCLLLTLALPQTTPMILYPIAAHDSITYSI